MINKVELSCFENLGFPVLAIIKPYFLSSLNNCRCEIVNMYMLRSIYKNKIKKITLKSADPGKKTINVNWINTNSNLLSISKQPIFKFYSSTPAYVCTKS